MGYCLNKEAVVCVAGNDSWSAVASHEHSFFGIKNETAPSDAVLVGVALVAVFLKDGCDVGAEGVIHDGLFLSERGQSKSINQELDLKFDAV